MATPVMLRTSSSTVPAGARALGVPAEPTRTDPSASIVVLLLGVVCVGLVAAGTLATEGWTTPDSQTPVVTGITVVFGVAAATLIGTAARRALRRGR